MHNITYKTISYTVTLQFGLSEQLSSHINTQ